MFSNGSKLQNKIYKMKDGVIINSDNKGSITLRRTESLSLDLMS